ncbi:MAG: bifunctional UDP-N-acetylmuramoyl-tripeptide:D-alanyl-D-alanine ligase/alanine racemase [Paludibacteraceae bacterium]|nr:bifunctional UDP-N-acetylmuramoyl-tripeptide:D-alanyl-D-alanine ligase/alanine racemase [Paludibacteraceae bacterium]MBR6106119.1 bifunctional UDP-N-acetylmuramoyl-tripeptide:D-alanyl-D-alanine ligase/alanine racemase [Paludibacteraceae bacterium]
MYSSEEICHLTNGKLQGDGKKKIVKLCIDSRALSIPEESLFIALRTSRRDGHQYIESLYRNGVRSFMVSDLPANAAQMEEADFIVVDDTLKALQTIAKKHRLRFDIPVIGITGSNGKTIVKEWLYQLLQKDYSIARSPRSYNSQIGVPLSVWEMDDQTQLGIFEAGISQVNEMDRLEEIIKPGIGIFTKLGDAHQENFSSMKVKCCEKLKLFKDSQTIIFNKDDKLVDICIQQSRLKGKTLSFGENQTADVVILEKQKKGKETTISYLYKGEKGHYSIPFSDDASIENSLLCITTLLHFGISTDQIQKRMGDLEQVAMRMELKRGQNGCTVIDDSYNSDINSLEIALDYLNQQADIKKNKKTLILSDIMQSGQSSEQLYESVQSLIIAKGVDKLIGIGSEIGKYEDLMDAKEKYFFATTEDFINHFNTFDFKNETILLKGSRRYHFEDISDLLSYAVHETQLEVNLTALVNNFNYFRSFLKPGTKICSMVKAYAYGSGDIEVSKTLQQNGGDYLAVAVADEGASLRKEGIHIPIMVMDPAPNTFPKIFEYNLEPEIYNFQMLNRIIEVAKSMDISNYPIHLKIDTGMHRLGFVPEEIDSLIKVLKGQSQVRVRSVFSHFVGSDSSDFDYFTKEQHECFKAVKDKIQKAFDYKIMAHICNSAGIERFSEYQYDMVRLGIGHYGISAIDNKRLQEVCTLKTNILQIKQVPANETVGYSRKGKLDRDSVIGAIPIGYADGLDRHLGNRNGKVWVNGKFAPIVGNICMDVCMIDLTGIEAQEGDVVEVFGPHQSITEIADKLGTIPYEVLTSVSRRVKRVYYKE